MRKTILIIFMLSIVIASDLVASSPVTQAWRRVRLESYPGEGRVVIEAELEPQTALLTKLKIRIGRRHVKCSISLFKDLLAPQLHTLNVISSSEEPATYHSVRFEYGEEALAEGRFPEVRVRIENGQCTGRSFAVPIEGGTQFQDEPPNFPRYTP
jgi:hypothetical protein